MMSTTSRVARFRARAERKLVWEAGRYADRHTGDFDRLESLSPIVATRTEPTFLLWTRDREMGQTLYHEGGYDAAELAWSLDHLGHPQRGRTVVEVGANIGTTTVPLLLLHGAAHVEAFEPEPANFKLLRCNLILNDVEDRATLAQIAISDSDGAVQLELCDWNAGDHRIRAVDPSWELLAESSRRSITVRSARLEDALGSDPSDVGLVWVDTQGHEAHVLAGAGALLAAGVPWIIEYWPYGLTRSGGLDSLHELIADHFSTVVDVRRSMDEGRPAIIGSADVATAARQTSDAYTDLILIP
jgi:FkbM family methyltransferase